MSESPSEAAPPPAEGEGTPTVAQLAERVDKQDSKLDRILEMLGGGGHDAPQAAEAAPEPPDYGAIVREEQAKLAAKEEAKLKREAEADAKLTDKIKQVVEKPPREFKKITETMQWIGPDDR